MKGTLVHPNARQTECCWRKPKESLWMLKQLCGKRGGVATITTDPPSASDPGFSRALVKLSVCMHWPLSPLQSKINIMCGLGSVGSWTGSALGMAASTSARHASNAACAFAGSEMPMYPALGAASAPPPAPARRPLLCSGDVSMVAQVRRCVFVCHHFTEYTVCTPLIGVSSLKY